MDKRLLVRDERGWRKAMLYMELLRVLVAGGILGVSVGAGIL